MTDTPYRTGGNDYPDADVDGIPWNPNTEFDARVKEAIQRAYTAIQQAYAAAQRAFPQIDTPPVTDEQLEELRQQLTGRPIILPDNPTQEELENMISRRDLLLEEGVVLAEEMLYGNFAPKLTLRSKLVKWVEAVNNIDARRDANDS